MRRHLFYEFPTTSSHGLLSPSRPESRLSRRMFQLSLLFFAGTCFLMAQWVFHAAVDLSNGVYGRDDDDDTDESGGDGDSASKAKE